MCSDIVAKFIPFWQTSFMHRDGYVTQGTIRPPDRSDSSEA
ncbi:hypothetical protein K0038_02459 [Pseudomonas syringae]|nr:hypothetical protein [Pseudomonas syringae]